CQHNAGDNDLCAPTSRSLSVGVVVDKMGRHQNPTSHFEANAQRISKECIMTLQLAQLGTMIKYELLMSWRRRSLIVTVRFLFVGLAVFTATIQKEPLGAEGGEILYMDDTVTPATMTLRLYETGEVTTIPADDAILANIPNWLRNVDLEQVNATLKVATL